MKLNLRLSKPKRIIKELLKKNHGLEGPITDWNDIKGSELYYGQSYSGEPSWKSFLEEGMDIKLNLQNQGAAAVLFVPSTKDRYLIYLFGYGFLKVEAGFTEWDFGLKIVLNSVPRNGLKSVNSHSLDYKAKNKSVQLGSIGGVGEFELDVLQDLVSHISGASSDLNFAKTLSGGDSLSINVDLEGSSLIKKGREIIDRYELNTYKSDFSWIDFIAPIKDKQLIEHLNKQVNIEIDKLIKGSTENPFVLSFPEIINMDILDHFEFRGYGSSVEYGMINMHTFVEDYKLCSNTYLSHDTENIRVDLYDGHSVQFDSFTFYKCLTTEIEFKSIFYILTHGAWFQLDKNHYNKVTHFFNSLITGSEYLKKGDTIETSEKDYLKSYKEVNHEILDRKLFYASTGPVNSIEYCDIVNDAQEIIHVKDGTSSSKLSHLFNQGLVAARLLNNDIKFRSDFAKLIKNKNIKTALDLKKMDISKITVVFRILKKGPDFNLPFFSKIVLYDIHQKIKAMGYKFKLEWVQYK